MGFSATSAARPTGHTALAGSGAAGSLLAAVVAAALIAPGAVDFDDWTIVPPLGSGGSLAIAGDSGSAPLVRGPAGSATAAPTALTRAGAAPVAAGERSRPAARRGGRTEGVRGRDESGVAGLQSSQPGLTTREPRPPDEPPPPGFKESVARTTEGASTRAGATFEHLGASGGDALEPVHPSLGRSARRAAAAPADRSRRTGKAAGDVVRSLPDAGPPASLLRHVVR